MDDSYGLLIANELTSSVKINQSDVTFKLSFSNGPKVVDYSNFQNEIIVS
jgi:hypothetical protein